MKLSGNPLKASVVRTNKVEIHSTSLFRKKRESHFLIGIGELSLINVYKTCVAQSQVVASLLVRLTGGVIPNLISLNLNCQKIGICL